MFLHLSVILSTGGMSASVHAGIHTHTPGQTPPDRHTPAQCYWDTQCPVHAGIDMATAADGMHPTGMHSCLLLIFTKHIQCDVFCQIILAYQSPRSYLIINIF